MDGSSSVSLHGAMFTYDMQMQMMQLCRCRRCRTVQMQICRCRTVHMMHRPVHMCMMQILGPNCRVLKHLRLSVLLEENDKLQRIWVGRPGLIVEEFLAVRRQPYGTGNMAKFLSEIYPIGLQSNRENSIKKSNNSFGI